MNIIKNQNKIKLSIMKVELLNVNPYINESIEKDFYLKLYDAPFIIIYKEQG